MASTASKAAATMSKTMATRGSSVPLKLLALPLSKQPELVYFYAHLDKKQRESKGKQPENAATTTDARINEFDDSKSGIAGEAGEAAMKTQEIADNRIEDGATFSQKIPQYISRATNYAAEKWEQFGKAKKENWRYKTYMTGERLMDRIEYEEWLLKALDASMAPKLLSRSSKPKVAADNTEGDKVPLYFPPSILTEEKALSTITSLLEHREPHHQSLLKRSMILIPFTFPFAILPVVPNFPLFYVLWRTWSHWRALKSSQYLKGLISHGQLKPEPSPLLDELYKKAAERGQSSLTQSSEKSTSSLQIQLTPEMVDDIIKDFQLADQAGVDLRRAISQAEARFKSTQS